MVRGPTDAAAPPASPADGPLATGAGPEATAEVTATAEATGSTTTGPPDGAAARPGWRERLTTPSPAMGLAVTLLPFAVGIVALVLVVGGDYHPVHDVAQTEMHIRDVGRHQVLLGPYSREGWYHPGPAMFYLLALPYRLLGGASVGMGVGALLINGAAVAGMAIIARRRGGTPLFLITLVLVGLLVRSLGPDFVRDPWNPSLPVLAFGVVLFLSWAMTCGEIRALPIAVAVASFVVQTHIGYLALAVPLVGWGAAWLVVLAVRRPDQVPRRRLARAGLVAAGLGAVLWALPVHQQLTTEPGNLGEAFEYFRLTDQPGHGLGDAWRLLAAQFTLTPEWLTGNAPWTITGESTALYGAAPVPVLLVPVVAAAVALWRRGSTDARRLLLTLGVAFALGVPAITNTTGLAFAYRLRWIEVLAMTAGLVVLWAGWLLLDDKVTAPRDVRRLGAATAAVVAVLAALNMVSLARAGTPQKHDSAVVAEVLPEVEAALPPGDGPVLIRPSSFGSMLFVPALQLGLERDGVTAVVDPITAAPGEHRLYRGGPLRAQLVVAVDHQIAPRLDDPTFELVGRWGDPPTGPPDLDDPVTAYEEAFPTGDTDRLEALARATLDDVGRMEAPYTIEALAIFSVPPGT
jgi:hypothetical protein